MPFGCNDSQSANISPANAKFTTKNAQKAFKNSRNLCIGNAASTIRQQAAMLRSTERMSDSSGKNNKRVKTAESSAQSESPALYGFAQETSCAKQQKVSDKNIECDQDIHIYDHRNAPKQKKNRYRYYIGIGSYNLSYCGQEKLFRAPQVIF